MSQTAQESRHSIKEGWLKKNEMHKNVSMCDIHFHSVGPEVYGICACTFF